MPPKQETHTERISALEGQINDFANAIDDLRDSTARSERSILEATVKSDQKFLEVDRKAEERHAQLMAMFQKQTVVVTNQDKVEPKDGGPGEIRGEKEGSASKTQGLQIRSEKGLLQVPETAIPFRSAELNTPSYHAGSSGYSAQQKLESPPKKLDLPNFEGKNPDDWIFRMEKCFSVNQTEEGEKLSLAMSCLMGCAVTWLRMIQDREEPLDWRDFKLKLRRRFKLTRGGTILSQMVRLRQTGTISEYREQFEELSAEVPHVTNDVLEEIFLHGMKRSLREQVVRLRPVGMDEIVDMAKIIEEQENDRNAYNNRSIQRTSSAPTLNANQRNYNSNSGNARYGENTSARKSVDSPRDNKNID